MGGQGVHERPHQVVRGEVEDEPERDGDGEGGQRLLEHGEQQEGQTQTLPDTEAGEREKVTTGWTGGGEQLVTAQGVGSGGGEQLVTAQGVGSGGGEQLVTAQGVGSGGGEQLVTAQGVGSGALTPQHLPWSSPQLREVRGGGGSQPVLTPCTRVDEPASRPRELGRCYRTTSPGRVT